MVKINIVAVGRVKENYYAQGIEEYVKRIKRFADVSVTEIDEVTFRKEEPSSFETAKIAEGKALIKKSEGYVIALTPEGKKFTSEQFADKLKRITDEGNSKITFVIGGSYGLSDEVKKSADLSLSFSDMTFPHTLFRLILAEQIYRAFMINSGSSYHK